MESKYKYRILRKQNLIIKYYAGDLSLQDLFKNVELTGNDTDYLPSMFVLNDIRDSVFVFNDYEILDFTDKIKKSDKLYDKRKIVFLTNSPNQVLFSTMIEIFKNETFIEICIASTIEKSLNHLGLPVNEYGLITNILNELKNAY